MTAYETGPICLDELVTVMGQYPTDQTWNGWLKPRLDPVGVEKVMRAFAEDPLTDPPPPEHTWTLENGVPLLIIFERDGDEVYPETYRPDEDGLYPLGAGGWCWSPDIAVTDEEARTP